jgi:sarcosine oxidase subunit gamma
MSDVTPPYDNAPAVSTSRHSVEQRPTNAHLGRSPLAHVIPPVVAPQMANAAGVRFTERRLLGHLTLRCDTQNTQQQVIAAQLLGVELPCKPLTSVQQDELAVCWLGPDEWLITVPPERAFALEHAFHERMVGHWALVDVSSGLTVYRLTGPCVVAMLKKSVPVDLHPTAFPVGKVVTTVFAKASATLRRVDEACWDVVVRRSFADDVWLWIQDASREFGFALEPDA